MANGTGEAPVRLGWGVTVQLILVLVAIGIAWGSLSAKQSALELNQVGITTTNAIILNKLENIQERLTTLEVTVRRKRGE